LVLIAPCRPAIALDTYYRKLADRINHQGCMGDLPKVLNDTSVNAERKATTPYKNQICGRFMTSRKRKRLTEILTMHCPTVTHIMCTRRTFRSSR
jgi:hypothetical protein